MKKNIKQLFQKGKKFLNEIKPNERIFVISHTDVDGLVSASLTFTALKRMGIKTARFMTRSVEGRREIPEDLKECDKAIILDLPIENFKEVKNTGKKVLIIDHHPQKDMNSRNIVYINPRLERKEIYQPASYVVYKFFSQIVNIEDREWLSFIGTIGDFGFEDCIDLIEKWTKIKSKSEILDTKFWEIVVKIRSASLEIGKNETIEILNYSKNMEDIDNNEKILLAYKKYEKKYRMAEEEFWKNAEEFNKINLVISTISKKIGSELTSEISANYPDKIIILLEKSDEIYKIHARYQSGKIHLGMLMKKICNGGGHKQAAGGSIPVSDFENFKMKLIKEISRMLDV